MTKTEIKTVQIDGYDGYRHNRYDGCLSSWGVLKALGASGVADCFIGQIPDNVDSDDIYRMLCNIGAYEDDDFRETVLQNLDDGIDEIKDLENDESCTLHEYAGDYRYDLVFTKTAEGISCDFDGDATYNCEI